MGRIPDQYLVHEVIVRRFLGQTATGKTYAPADTIPCLIEEKRSLVRDSDGNEVVSSARFWAAPETPDIPPESEVDYRGRTTTVITFAKHDGGGLATPDHVEVNLT